MVVDKPELEALKSRHPILSVARDLGLEVQHNRFRCPHPEGHSHGDRTPSVTLWPERGFFKCWVCDNVKGDVIDLIRAVKGLGFSEAVDFLNRGGGRTGHGSVPHHHGAQPAAPAQTELFREMPGLTAPAAQTSINDPNRSAAWDMESDQRRRQCLESFLSLCVEVRGKAASWLRKRRIFQKTWATQRLRTVGDYGAVSDLLSTRFLPAQLRDSGLFNAEGHLRFYRHPLILPYFDAQGEAVYLQARAIDPEIKPKELSLAGPIPCPYNARLLDGEPGHLYLCEGVIDTLTLLEAGFPAVGIPGAANFKPAWTAMFRKKSVYVAFDADAAGEAGATKTIALLSAEGVETHRLAIPAGKDINDWLRGGR